MSKEAMTLALDALNKLTDAAGGFSVSGVYFNEGVWEQECLNAAYDAIKALEEVLAKQEQGEPVGQLLEDAFGRGQVMWFNKPKDESMLYTTPQPAQKPWVGLTDEELRQIWYDDAPVEGGTYVDKLRQVEAKLKEKNNG